MSKKVILTSGVVLKIDIGRNSFYFFAIGFTIKWNSFLCDIRQIIIISDLLSSTAIGLRFGTMRGLGIIWSFNNMWLGDTIMRMRYNFCMRCTSGMHNSHISKKENGKNYDDADEFLMEKEHLILSIRIRWEKGKLFSGGNIPSPN